ncbi:MAG: hypothetical protein IKL48_00170 [Elusimicrobiaceae bacterium]|nr:hypothetical protein [Elusimicrobiaceae bacterium]
MAETKLNDNQLAQAGLDGESAATVLTELQTKYAQGKIALAKALTSRGQATESKEEILAMASKVYNIVPSDDTENIYVKMRTSYTRGQLNDNGSNYTNWKEVNQNQDVVLWRGGFLYYIPYGNYSNIDELLAGVKFSLEVGDASNSFCYMGVSLDGTKVAIFTTQYDLKVYDIKEDRFELLHEVTVQTYYPNGNIAVTNDGSLVVYANHRSNYEGLSYYNFNTSQQALLTPIMNTETDLLFKDGYLYVFECTGGSDSRHKIRRRPVSFDENGAVTFGAETSATVKPGGGDGYIASARFYRYADELIVYCITAYEKNDPRGAMIYNLSIAKVSDLLNLYPMSTLPMCVISASIQTSSLTDLVNTHVGIWPFSAKIELEGNLLKFRSARLVEPLIFDIETGQWQTTEAIICDYSTQNSYDGNMPHIIDNPDTGIIITCDWQTNISYSPCTGRISRKYITFYHYTKDKKLIGKKYKGPNGDETWFLSPCRGDARVNAGYFDLNIPVAPETEESGE